MSGTIGSSNSNAIHLFFAQQFEENNSRLQTLNEQEGIQIFPNPFNTQAILTVPHDLFQPFDLKIFDCSGRLVREMTNIVGSELVIEQDDLNAGVYVIELQGNQVLHTKIVIQ